MERFEKVLVANRGAVAARVLRALDRMGVRSVAVYSQADAGAPYLDMAGETYEIGPAPERHVLGADAFLPEVPALERHDHRPGQRVVPEHGGGDLHRRLRRDGARHGGCGRQPRRRTEEVPTRNDRHDGSSRGSLA